MPRNKPEKNQQIPANIITHYNTISYDTKLSKNKRIFC